MSVCMLPPEKKSSVIYIHVIKPASNDYGCICKQIGKEQFRMKAYITINRTKLYCPKLCIKLIITMKNFFTFVMPLKWTAIIGYM